MAWLWRRFQTRPVPFFRLQVFLFFHFIAKSMCSATGCPQSESVVQFQSLPCVPDEIHDFTNSRSIVNFVGSEGPLPNTEESGGLRVQETPK
mmetsp:Transcript_98553/g.226458  ORF Transcript_98553/g.226458 Transcript_98553/m.226458 type:complete len:92 (+) Transcript_98553:361-636(+)